MVGVVTGTVDTVVDGDTSGERVALDDTSDEEGIVLDDTSDEDVAVLDEDASGEDVALVVAALDNTSVSLRDGVNEDTSSLDNEVAVANCVSDEDETLLVGVS
jgi:hypothetical protein